MIRVLGLGFLIIGVMACDSDFTTPDIVLVNLGIDPVSTENMNTSYHKSRTSLAAFDYSTLTDYNPLVLHEAVAYLDADGDSDIDIFFATGDGSNTATDAEFHINDGAGSFTNQAGAFLVDYQDPPVANIPRSLHATKALVADLNLGDGHNLDEIVILDSGEDGVTSGSSPKVVLHHLDATDNTIHYFHYQIYSQDIGVHTTGSAADVDNDGDADVFVGGPNPFFYINNGYGSFTRVHNRLDISMSRVDAAELIDIDLDGYVDLIAGAEEATDATTIYWGNSTGAYSDDLSTRLPIHSGYGVILDFEVEQLDGDSNKDIVIYRTSASDTNRVVQIIKNNGSRNFAVSASFTTDTSSRWLRVQGIDIYPDNAVAGGSRFVNDGNLGFTQIYY